MNKAILDNYISLQSVKKTFLQGSTKQEVLKGISYKFLQGESYALKGASGVGKSTLMHILSGLDSPTSGDIFLNDKAFSSFNPKEYKHYLGQVVGLVFQQPYLIPELTVLENVMLKSLLLKKDREALEEEARGMLNEVGLNDKADSYPGSLSGGQQQRVALCRALIQKPQFLLADEPTGNLDAETGKQIIDLILAYQKKYGMGIIISSHDPMVLEALTITLEIQDGFLYAKEQ